MAVVENLATAGRETLAKDLNRDMSEIGNAKSLDETIII